METTFCVVFPIALTHTYIYHAIQDRAEQEDQHRGKELKAEERIGTLGLHEGSKMPGIFSLVIPAVQWHT